MDIINEHTKESRLEYVKIQYDMLHNYCMNCKFQGHAEEECRVLYHDLNLETNTENHAKDTHKSMENTNNNKRGKTFCTVTGILSTRDSQERVITSDNDLRSLLDTNIMEEQGGEGSRVKISGNKGTEEEIIQNNKQESAEKGGQQYSSTKEWISQVFNINNGTQIKEVGTGISNNVAQKYPQHQQLCEAHVNKEEKKNQLNRQKSMNKMTLRWEG